MSSPLPKRHHSQEEPFSRKYRFRPICISGEMLEVTWLYDHEIDEALKQREGKPISFVKAVEIYFDALYDVTNGPNLEVQRLNILTYARSQGYRVELFEYLIERNAS